VGLVHAPISQNLVGFVNRVARWAEATLKKHISDLVRYSTAEDKYGASLIQCRVYFCDPQFDNGSNLIICETYTIQSKGLTARLFLSHVLL
jgi:hypothetical protein